MNTFIGITSRLFDVLLAPFGTHAGLHLWLWSLLGGIVALAVYRLVSDQAGIERVKNKIKVRLLEIRLFQEDLRRVLTSTGRILALNGLYLGYNLVPFVVLVVPMMTILVQLEAHYAFAPIEPGSVRILRAKLDPDAGLDARTVRLGVPPGIELTAPPVRTPGGEIAWRLRVLEAGDHELELTAGGRTETKGIAAGGEPRKVPKLRTQGWLKLLYPGEAPLAADSPFESIDIDYPDRDLGWIPGGEGGVLLFFFGVSILAAFLLKGFFGVTL